MTMPVFLSRALLCAALAGAARPLDLAAQLDGAIPSMRLASGRLSFDGHATPGDFTGTTTTVTGEMTGGESLAAVRGWVESPVKTLDTDNGKRDKDLNKSMESDKYPAMRFELTGVTSESARADTATAQLQGKLTLHGVTRDVALPGRVWKDGGGLRLRSDFPLDLGDYEIGGLTKMLGMLRMQEAIEVHVDLTFAPR
jgi:polyisoprenoid-binding protein YceI